MNAISIKLFFATFALCVWLTASAHIGWNCKIADDVIINDATIKNHVRIERSTKIGKNVTIGTYSRIGENCTINGQLGEGVRIGKSSVVESNAIVGDSSLIGENCLIDGKIGIGVTVGSSTKIGPESKIDKNSQIGKNCTINGILNGGVYIKWSTIVGLNANIDNWTMINENCLIEGRIGRDVVVHHSTKIGLESYITSNSNIGARCTIGNGVRVRNSAEIEGDVILDDNSTIHWNIKIGQKAYIGQHASVFAEVPKGAVVHRDATIPSKMTLEKGGVVIASPNSYKLYEQSEDIKERTEQVNVAANQSDEISPEFNAMLNDIIDEQFNELNQNCEDFNLVTIPSKLQLIKSLYLIHYHGFESFKSNRLAAKSFQSLVAQQGDTHENIQLIEELVKENHFGNDSTKDILEPKVKEKFIQLLTLEMDAHRANRVSDDTFCTMVDQIQTNNRTITCVPPLY